jgi:hypothetical protein
MVDNMAGSLRMLCLAVLLLGCEDRWDGEDAHMFAGLPRADFAGLCAPEAFQACEGACDSTMPGLVRFSPLTVHYGVINSSHFVINGISEASLQWWARGRPLKLLLVGNNGAPPGWTAGRTYPVDSPDPDAHVEPLCGLTTDTTVAELVIAAWVLDEDHGTYFNAQWLASSHERFAASGRDLDGNVVPDSIGAKNKKHIQQGVVIERERVEEDLQVTARRTEERRQFDESFTTGVCVVP